MFPFLYWSWYLWDELSTNFCFEIGDGKPSCRRHFSQLEWYSVRRCEVRLVLWCFLVFFSMRASCINLHDPLRTSVLDCFGTTHNTYIYVSITCKYMFVCAYVCTFFVYSSMTIYDIVVYQGLKQLKEWAWKGTSSAGIYIVDFFTLLLEWNCCEVWASPQS